MILGLGGCVVMPPAMAIPSEGDSSAAYAPYARRSCNIGRPARMPSTHVSQDFRGGKGPAASGLGRTNNWPRQLG